MKRSFTHILIDGTYSLGVHTGTLAHPAHVMNNDT